MASEEREKFSERERERAENFVEDSLDRKPIREKGERTG